MAKIEEIMQAMPTALVPEKAAGVNATVQFQFTGEGASQYVVKVQDGKCEVSEGTAPDPRTTVTVAASDWVDIAEGRLSGMSAFMTGKLRVEGDMMFMMQFQQMFEQKPAQS